MKNLRKTIIAVTIVSSIAYAVPTAKQKFSNADINHDGVLSSQEFYGDQAMRMEKKIGEGKALKGVSTAPHFDEVDTNSDGKVTFNEYDIFHTQRQKEMIEIRKGGDSSNGKNFAIFTRFDKDSNGCIDKNEFRELMKSDAFKQGKGKGN